MVDKDRFALASLDIHYTGNDAELIPTRPISPAVNM